MRLHAPVVVQARRVRVQLLASLDSDVSQPVCKSSRCHYSLPHACSQPRPPRVRCRAWQPEGREQESRHTAPGRVQSNPSALPVASMCTHSATTQPVTASPCLAHTSGSALPDLQARKAALTAPQRLLMCLCTAFSVALGAGAAVSDMLHAAGDNCVETLKAESAAGQAGALAVENVISGRPRRRRRRRQ